MRMMLMQFFEHGGGQLLINSRNDTIINIDSNNDSTDAHFAIAHGAATDLQLNYSEFRKMVRLLLDLMLLL